MPLSATSLRLLASGLVIFYFILLAIVHWKEGRSATIKVLISLVLGTVLGMMAVHTWFGWFGIII